MIRLSASIPAAILAGLLLACPLAACRRTTPPPGRCALPLLEPARLKCCPDKSTFVKQSGLNLPWISYGHDVGWPHVPGRKHLLGFRNLPRVIGRRARLPASMKMLRVWMMADDRAGAFGPAADPGFTARCIRDMDAFMKATPDDTAVIWVIYDFMIGDGKGSPWGGKAGECLGLVHSRAGWRKAWSTLKPCIKAIQKRHGRRIIWDIINEPLNGSRLVEKDAHLPLLEGFIQHHMIQLLKMEARVTFGARSLSALRNVWKDMIRKLEEARNRIVLNPDHLVIQFHHYPGSELHHDSSLKTFTAAGLRRELGLDRRTPVILGEAWTGSNFNLTDYFAMGFSGALFWQDKRLGSAVKAAAAQARQLFAKPEARWRVETGTRPSAATAPSVPNPTRIERPILIPLMNCRILRTGPPWEQVWMKKLGYAAMAFTKLAVDRSGGLKIQMDVSANPDMRTVPIWAQKKRKGEVLCSPGEHPSYDLRNTEVEVRLVPPVEAVADRYGSGAQIVLQDTSGRRLHSAWTSFSPVTGGGLHLLRFRPPTEAVPGMGFRHKGFDLSRVSRVGFLWAAATFSSARYRAAMTLRSLRVSPARGRLLKGYIPPPSNVRRPSGQLALDRCRFEHLGYLYLQGLGPSSGKGNHSNTFTVRMDPKSPFRRAGAIEADLATGCSFLKGHLADLRNARLNLSVSSPAGRSFMVQVFLTDASGTSCYSRKTARAGEILSVKLDYGPRVCAHGPGVDFARIRKVGIKFFLPGGAASAVSGPVSVRSFLVLPPGSR